MWFFLKVLVYCGNNRRGNATYKELKSGVHPSESQSPSMWRGKTRLGDLGTSRHVGLWARQELEPWRFWLKTDNKFMPCVQTVNYPETILFHQGNHDGYPAAPTLAIPLVPHQPGFTAAPRKSRGLLTWTGWRISICPWKLPKCFKDTWRVLDKAPSMWGCVVWWAHVLPCSRITHAIHHNA